MFDQSQNLKTRINLPDYDYQKEVSNRLLLGSLSKDEIKILEEITFSPTTFTLDNLAKNTDLSKDTVAKALEKIEPSGLLKVDGETITINKDYRKYFELHIEKFDEDFSPNLNFLKSLLKRVPLDVLPLWYPIPRSSDNIFESLVEKFLLTPQLINRYVGEIKLSSDILKIILDEIEASPSFFVSFEHLAKNFDISKEAFYEASLTLEFLLIAAHTFETINDKSIEGITFFNEWKNYLVFKEDKHPIRICKPDEVVPTHNDVFFFTNSLSRFLDISANEALHLVLDASERWVLASDSVASILAQFEGFSNLSEEDMYYFNETFSKIIHCCLFLKLIKIENSQVVVSEKHAEWQSLDVEKQALHLYRTLVANYPFNELSESVCKERKIHEIEKSLDQIPDQDWILLSEFLDNLTLHLSAQSECLLTRFGKKWKYTLPAYSEQELSLIEKVVYDWLFQIGAIERGLFQTKPCIRLTPFGKKVFATS